MKCVMTVLLVFLSFSDQAVYATEKNIELLCDEYSKGSSYDYEIVHGKVIGLEFFPKPNMGCLNSKGCLNGYAATIYVLDQLETMVFTSNQKIAVYTPLSLASEIYNIEPRMIRGNKYKFCARQVNEYDFLPALTPPNLTIYKIDWVDTIQSY